MAYNKHAWTPQELITADKLNNIEDGISDNIDNIQNISDKVDNSAIDNTPKLNGNNLYVGDNTYMGTNTFMDGISLNGKNKVNNLTDTDWLDIPLAKGRTGKAKYKVSLGKVFVHIDGVKGMGGVGPGNTASHIGNLPKGGSYPSRHITILNKSLIDITCTPDGLIYISGVVGDQPGVNGAIYTDFVVI